DQAVVPPAPRPADAGTAFRHLMRTISAGFVDEWTTAEREARTFAQLRAVSADAQRLLGVTLSSAEKRDEALKALDASLKLTPNSAPTLYQRAGVLRAMGRRSEAEADLRHASELDPSDAETLLALGQVLAAGDKYTEARDVLQRGLKVAPNHPM